MAEVVSALKNVKLTERQWTKGEGVQTGVNELLIQKAPRANTITVMASVATSAPPDLTHFVVVIRDEAHQSQEGGAPGVVEFIHSTWPQAVQEGEGRWTMPSGWKVYLLRIPQLDISSSLIRAKMAQGGAERPFFAS